jgi:hypothetical protein
MFLDHVTMPTGGIFESHPASIAANMRSGASANGIRILDSTPGNDISKGNQYALSMHVSI